MRYAVAIVLIVVLSPFSGIVSGEYEQDGIEKFESSSIMEGYSIPVQLAFDRAEDLSLYSQDEIFSAKEWLVVTGIPQKEHTKSLSNPISSIETKVLPGSYIWEMEDGRKAVESLTIAMEIGEIESFSPVIKMEHTKKFYPNDPEFGSQWHLENSGQTGGLSGEDANLTGAWDSYNGSGVVISIVDDLSLIHI